MGWLIIMRIQPDLEKFCQDLYSIGRKAGKEENNKANKSVENCQGRLLRE